ncbi:hypothetical protein Taro_004657 [Colocasia esculenta]|uniref:glutathione gamma-glutamylcysteinyltransferase n=1 Tax=Colocasia esculenta TaxID=4460 RepID=A0A843TQ34_COLES|nr:hypothetical protein [Colocasia esculenta]
MATAGLYRRVLPSPPAMEFSSAEGKQLFCEALQQGTMEGFFTLISHFQTQCEPAYCGLASLAMVLNALAIDPGRKWKGPWRWFDESMLDCCEPLEEVKVKGTTFGTVACLALCAGAKVEPFRTNEITVDDFRSHIVRCTSSQHIHLIASYHRRPFKQVFHIFLDTLCNTITFSVSIFPSYFGGTNFESFFIFRFMLISKTRISPSVLYTLSCRNESCVRMAKYLIEDIPSLLESKNPNTISEIVSLVLTAFPTECQDLLRQGSETRGEEENCTILSTENKRRLIFEEQVLQQVHKAELHKYAKHCLSSAVFYSENESGSNDDGLYTLVSGDTKQGVHVLLPVSETKNHCPSKKSLVVSPDTLTVLLLALPPETWSSIKHEGLLEEIQNAISIENLPDDLQEEARVLKKVDVPAFDDAGKGAPVSAFCGELRIEAPVEGPCG